MGFELNFLIWTNSSGAGNEEISSGTVLYGLSFSTREKVSFLKSIDHKNLELDNLCIHPGSN